MVVAKRKAGERVKIYYFYGKEIERECLVDNTFVILTDTKALHFTLHYIAVMKTHVTK